MRTVKVTVDGIDYEVTGTYHKPRIARWHGSLMLDEAKDASFEADSIKDSGVDVTDLLIKACRRDIEAEAAATCQQEDYERCIEALEAAADAAREERLLRSK